MSGGRSSNALWKTALVLIQVLLLTQAAGCQAGNPVASAAETHVNKDGSAERRTVIDANPPGPRLATTTRWSIESGLDTKKRSFSRSRSFDNLADGNEHAGMKLVVEDYFFWRTYSFSDGSYGIPDAQRSLSGEVGYKLVMPGRISAAPGAKRKSGGVAIYRLDDKKSFQVRAESWSIRWWASAATVLGLLVVAALILGGRAADLVKGVGRWLWTGRFRPVQRE